MGYCCGGRKTAPLSSVPALNAASARRLALESGQAPSALELTERRIGLCRSCPYFNPSQEACNRCGCLVAAKVGKERESCPLRRW
jgi:hypothetical protein